MRDIHKIREDFPQLRDENYHYLDSAATSLTPTVVLDAVLDYYITARANVHRGIFHEANKATHLYEEARKKVAAFINADPKEIIFTSGATESSNMIARMLGNAMRDTKKKNGIVATDMEHHGALLPLEEIAKEYSFDMRRIPIFETGLDYAKAQELITEKTGIVSIILASNVLGTINDVRRIADCAHRQGATVVVDATAGIGHIPVDVRMLNADALYFSGHKMFAPTGIGILWVKRELLAQLSPVYFGGHMIERMEKGKSYWASIPARFEAGTKNIAGAIGLGAATDYINTLGLENIHQYVSSFESQMLAALEGIEGLHVFAEKNVERNIGITSFSCDWAHPHDVAEILARERVAVRPGHHCAIPLHNTLGVPATTRASLHVYNRPEDIDALVAALKKAKKLFT